MHAVVGARFEAQLLGEERGADAVAVADRLLAVQAQDLRSARLALRARTHGLSVADVDRALSDERTLVIGWLSRGTLHLVRREDYWWLHALTTPPLFTGCERRLRQTGVSERAAERGLETIARALAVDGPLTRAQLAERVQAADVSTAGQALIHLLMLACLRGTIVRGPLVGKHHAYALARDWVGKAPAFDRERALAELARRYLVGHAPAGERDLAKWAGLPLRDARAGLGSIASELVERDDGLLALERRPASGVAARTVLLDQWDPILVGWSSRALLLRDYPQRDRAETHFRPFAFVHGVAAATWGFRGGAVEIEKPFGRVTEPDRRALAGEAEDVVRFLSGQGRGQTVEK